MQRIKNILDICSVRVCVFVCVFNPLILDVRLFVDVPAGVTQEEGHTGFSTFLLRCLS